MEQYWMPKELDFENLRICLDNFVPEFLFIRLVGSRGGTVKVSEDSSNKMFDFKKDESGLQMMIDGSEVFNFPLKSYQKGFSLAYERFDEDGRMLMLSKGEDPYDPKLLEPYRSILRTVLDDHLMEVAFKGRIPLKFHSWLDRPHFEYWTIDV